MYEPSLYERIGGIAGVKAIVRAVHQQARGDPDIPVIIDEARTFYSVHADILLLTDALRGRRRPDRQYGGLLSQPDVVTRHFRDSLWLLGMSGALVDAIANAVLDATALDCC